jgi:hypothetical protein
VTGHRDGVTLNLSAHEALVLFDWLARTSAAGKPVPFADQAEQRVLWDLDACSKAGWPSLSPTTMQPC